MIRSPRLLCIALLASTSCLSVDPPLPVRTFGLGVISAPAAKTGSAPATPKLYAEFSSAPLLRQEMVWQLSDVEVVKDELAIWSAAPSVLVEDAFEAYFYDDLGYTPGRAQARLKLHLSAFEADVTGSAEQARVRVRAILDSRSIKATRRTFEAASPLSSRSPDDLARAMSASLSTVFADIAAWLDEEFAAQSPRM